MKDWTGNVKSVFTTIGASNHTSQVREQYDYYATSPETIDKLESKFNLPHRVWECACGGGHLSERLSDLGHDVYSTDIVDRGYAGFNGEFDFLNPVSPPKPLGSDFCILTNPPYKFATEFILRALEMLDEGGYACFLLKTTALEGKKRYETVYRDNPPLYVFQFVERLLCAKNADFDGMGSGGGSAVSYAWFVWQKGYKGNTIIEWI